MSEINFHRTYNLGAAYEDIRERASQVLVKYLAVPGLVSFNDFDRSVTFTSERLVPARTTGRPRVMLLFSNPHPHSVHQGMLLSPNTRGRENDFWPLMEAAGWLPIPKEHRAPGKLVETCLKVQYPGPFELVFYCFFAFPTNDPKELLPIFGKDYFRQHIEPEAQDEFLVTLRKTPVEAVVTFNKGIYNRISNRPVDQYIQRLEAGEVVQGVVKGIESHVPIFLTFPTGWWRSSQQDRKASLERIRTSILHNL